MSRWSAPLEERFWSKTRQDGDCLVWTAGRSPAGYGRFNYAGGNRIASRVAYELSNGAPIPDGLVVRHTCDNPPCVRPEHLVLGTRADNNRDARERGQWVAPPRHRGERHPQSKLSERDVQAIRAARERGESSASVAARFGIDRSQVRNITTRRHWAHV